MAEHEHEKFIDLSASDYPFTIEYLAEDADLEVLDRIEVTGPGGLQVPSFAPRKVTVRATFPTRVYITTSSGNTYTQERES